MVGAYMEYMITYDVHVYNTDYMYNFSPKNIGLQEAHKKSLAHKREQDNARESHARSTSENILYKMTMEDDQ